MHRNEAAENFVQTPAIKCATNWLNAAAYLLNGFIASSGPINFDEPSTDSFQKILHPQTLRIRRYIAALSRLTFDAEKPTMTPQTDGAHSILKSLFELYVEAALCLTYKDIFGIEPDPAGHYLHQRVYLYASFVKMRSNYQKYFSSRELIEKLAKPENLAKIPRPEREYLMCGQGDAETELKRTAISLQYSDTPYSKVNHWFPERDMHGTYFTHREKDKSHERAKDVGSVAWRCKAILAKHYPVPALRGLWPILYDNYYDILNQRTHPSLGFDETFRTEAERIFDYAEQLVGARLIFQRCITPMLSEAFSKWWRPPDELIRVLNECDEAATELVLNFEPQVR